MWGQSEPKITRSGSHALGHQVDVVLPERVDPHVAAQRLDRIVLPVTRHLVGRRPDLGDEVGEVLRPVLDRGDPEVREALEHVVEDDGQQVVPDGLLDGERLDRRLPAAAEGGGEPVDGIAVGRGPAVAGVDHHGDPGIVGQLPEAVEHGVEGRPPPEGRGRRRRSHDDGPGAVVERPGQLLHGPRRIGQREVGGREDAIVVVEGPVLDQPAVERPEQRHTATGSWARGSS